MQTGHHHLPCFQCSAWNAGAALSTLQPGQPKCRQGGNRSGFKCVASCHRDETGALELASAGLQGALEHVYVLYNTSLPPSTCAWHLRWSHARPAVPSTTGHPTKPLCPPPPAVEGWTHAGLKDRTPCSGGNGVNRHCPHTAQRCQRMDTGRALVNHAPGAMASTATALTQPCDANGSWVCWP
jgi:hypothetical protein